MLSGGVHCWKRPSFRSTSGFISQSIGSPPLQTRTTSSASEVCNCTWDCSEYHAMLVGQMSAGVFSQRRVGRQRFLFEDVQPGPGKPARIEGCQQGPRIDDAAAGRVDQDRFRFHPGERAGVDQVSRLGQKGAMSEMNSRRFQQRVQRNQVHALLGRERGSTYGSAATMRRSPEGEFAGGGAADIAEADNPQRAARHAADASRPFHVPSPGFHPLPARGDDVPGCRPGAAKRHGPRPHRSRTAASGPR